MDPSNVSRVLPRGVVAAYSSGSQARESASPPASDLERASAPVWRGSRGAGHVWARRGRAGHVPRERIIWRGRRSGMFLLKSGWPLLAALVVLQVLGLAAPALGDLALPLLATAILVLLTFVAWWVPARVCQWIFHRYTLTEARVVKSSGVVRGRREEVEVRSVVRIHVEQHGFMQKILDMGTVELRTATGSLALIEVSRPREIASVILAQLPIGAAQPLISAASHELVGLERAVVESSVQWAPLPLASSTRPNTGMGIGSYTQADMRYVSRALEPSGQGFVNRGEAHDAAGQGGHDHERRLYLAPAPLVVDVPGIRGLSLLEAIVKAQSAGLDLVVVGERQMASCAPGRVLEQMPNPGVCRLTAPEVRVVLTTTCGTGGRP